MHFLIRSQLGLIQEQLLFKRCQKFIIGSVYGSLYCTVIILLPSSILKGDDNGYQQGENKLHVDNNIGLRNFDRNKT